MTQYRLYSMPVAFKELLDSLEAQIIEEEFNGIDTFLIYSDTDISAILDSFSIKFDMQDVESTGWQHKWKDYIEEGSLTETFLYSFDIANNNDFNTIYINPALAFGTGNHATTKLAANMVEYALRKGKLTSALDIGTGSGILSILMEKLGVETIEAIDIDKNSITNASENIEINNCKHIKVFKAEASEIIDKKYDIVVANIVSNVLLSINSDISRLASKYIVLSGILAREEVVFLSKLKLEGFKLLRRDEMASNTDSWISFIFARQ